MNVERIWAKNLLFVSLCLLALGAIAGGLWPQDRLTPVEAANKKAATLDDIAAVVAKVDAEFREHWRKEELSTASAASGMAVARRLSLGLTGTIPSLEEIRVLQSLPEENRADWFLNRLLDDQRYADHVAERLARMYVGVENGPFIVFRRRRFVSWLSDSLEENARYDEIVRKLISDTGIWTSTPAVNFLTVTLGENEGEGKPDPVRLAGRTSRAFLGMRIDCLQCHDDRLGNVALGTEAKPREGLQSDFHELAAFFSDCRISPLGMTDRKSAYKFKYLDADKTTIVDSKPPFMPELLDQQEGNRRKQLAKWVTHPKNKPFARSAVNRAWAILFGKPLVEPIDDIPLHGDYPPGLETLADDFVKHGFNLRRLFRVIASTEAYRLDSRGDFEVTPRHELHWAVFPLSRLRPEQVAGSLIQSCSLRTIDANSHIIFELAKYFQQSEFVERYGDAGEDEFDARAGTIPQRLLLMNGGLIKERTRPEFGNASTRIARQAPDDKTAIETLYLCTLTRSPSLEEQAYFLNRLKGSRGEERARRMEDLFWVLLNSTEFSWNH